MRCCKFSPKYSVWHKASAQSKVSIFNTDFLGYIEITSFLKNFSRLNISTLVIRVFKGFKVPTWADLFKKNGKT